MPFYEKGKVRIHYEEAGSGFPLLLIPGLGLNATPPTVSPPARSRSTGHGNRLPRIRSA